MIESLLLKVHKEVKEKGILPSEADKLGPALVKQLNLHIEQLTKRTEQAQKQLEEDKREQSKKITSDDVHEGFSSKVKSSFRHSSIANRGDGIVCTASEGGGTSRGSSLKAKAS